MRLIFKTWLGICLSTGALLLAGCGGGGEQVAGVGSGGTGSNRSYAAGVVTQSNGELVVNGVHFETSDATVSDANEPGKPLAPAAIQPGMMVEVDAASIRNSGGKQVAKAERIRIASQITGHVLRIGNGPYELPGWPKDFPGAIPTPVDAAASLPTAALAASAAENPDVLQNAMVDDVSLEEDKILYVLGMKVLVQPETRFDESLPDGLSSVKMLDVVEVHGFFDAQSYSIIATRILKKPKDTKYFTLQGKVINLDALNKFFRLDGWPLLLQNLSKGLTDLLKNGRVVQIKFPPALLKYSGTSALSLNLLSLPGFVSVNVPQSSDKLDAVVDGLVTHVHDETGQLISINNVEINLANVVVRCEDRVVTSCPAPKLSDRLRVRGELVKDKMIANEVVVMETARPIATPVR